MSVCKQGWPFVIGCWVVSAVFSGLGQALQSSWPGWIAGLAFLASLYCAYFFRDPARTVPSNDKWILSPADGKVMEAIQSQDNGQPVWMVRIFLSVFDPHLQRAPLAGKIRAIRYKQGKFLDARHPQAHVENEQNRIELETSAGPVTITQIAGLIARRIVWWVKEGETLAVGQQYGLIRFGSQVDITFPVSAKLRVQAGERVKAGESVLAEL